jgi:MoaA/NifB/PqqE/SkfB family radical SAM enzyme
MLLHRHLDAILDSGLSHLSIAIDGITPQDYSRYRVGGDLDTVLRNVKALLAARAERGAVKPVVQVRMIMFSYNEDQEAKARAFLDSLGADVVSLKRPSYEGPRTPEAQAFLAQVDRGGESGGRPRRFARPDGDPALLFRNQRLCPQLERPTVLSDGSLVACGVDGQGLSAYGNLNDAPFRALWRGPAHRELIRSFLRGDLAPCQHCTLTDRDPPPPGPGPDERRAAG